MSHNKLLYFLTAVFVAALTIAVFRHTALGISGGAKNGYAFSFTAGEASVTNECASVLSIDLNPGITGCALGITYDPELVAFSRFEADESFPADMISAVDNGFGQVRLVFLSTTGVINAVGSIATLYFKSANTAECSSALAIAPIPNSVYNTDYTAASFTCASGSVSFLPPPCRIDDENGFIFGVAPETSPERFAASFTRAFSDDYELVRNDGDFIGSAAYVLANDRRYDVVVTGDTNGDGTIGVIDYITVRLYLLSLQPLDGGCYRAADVDSNGKINILDFIALRLYLLGISELSWS